MSARFRSLNRYEAMLSTSTCNVGLELHFGSTFSTANDLKKSVRMAWQRTVSDYKFLQLKLEGTTTTLVENATSHEMLLQFREGDEFNKLEEELQKIGTSALNINQGLYYVNVCLLEHNSAQLVFSFCHGLSDGPGSLQVIKTFVGHLSAVISNQRFDQPTTKHIEVVDLQARLLGNDYGIHTSARDDVFKGLQEYKSAVLHNDTGNELYSSVLPQEALQKIPSDPVEKNGSIQCIKFSLSQAETTKLRETSRLFGSTVQGALVAAALHTRVELLKLPLPVLAAVQIPVNTRRLADIEESECLCGSAGVWHTLKVTQDLWNMAALSSQSTHESLRTQPKEWLRRLFHEPQTLPPYSVMVSSIGVAPIENNHEHFQIKQLLFFGGALQTLPKAQATMVHALTFDGKLNAMVNFTSPGISKMFIQKTADLIKATLQSMSNTNIPRNGS